MSLRRAVDAMCRRCICDERAGGTWRAQTEACTATTCPLYEYRPKTLATTRAEADPRRQAHGVRMARFLSNPTAKEAAP